MTHLQLVRRQLGDGSRQVDAIPNPRELPFPELVEGRDRALLLGTDELLRLAVRLREAGFRASSVTLSNLRYEPVIDEELNDQVVEALRTLSEDEVGHFSVSALDDRLVLAVTLLRRSPAISQIRLTQNGSLTVPEDATDSVLGDLRRALVDS